MQSLAFLIDKLWELARCRIREDPHSTSHLLFDVTLIEALNIIDKRLNRLEIENARIRGELNND